ncbi:probable cytochrome P450 6d4 [Contarinia nasturtii]|uniref:probable cytochrome P450 6d4 n=1 Tax=Contarinia nasturtii TaxID=265458 RepID=UPI0012D3EA01|nr:probable cytochrome P450 6d4 [Contarinia nasturtii]
MIALYLIIVALSVFYLWLKRVYNYWERLGFPSIKPTIPLGNLSDSFLGRKSIGKELYDLHRSSNKPVEGVYFLFKPALLFRDAKLIKNILTTDFASFYDRGFYHNPKDEVAGNMSMKSGQDWKNLRAKLTPAFTSGKLKAMMPTIIQIAQNLNRKLSPSAQNNAIVDIKDLTIRFAMDVIGTVGFGIDVNTIDEPNHSFRKIEEQISSGEFINRIRLIGAFFCPKLLEILGMSSQSGKFKSYMLDLVKNTMEYRETNNVIRKDFIHLLMQLRNTGKVDEDNDTAFESISKNESLFKSMSIEQCAAEVALFYLAGFDTTSSTVAYTLFELSRKPKLLKKLYDEIDNVLAEHNNEITFDGIKDMTFLDMCVKESVRKYPTLPFLNRICTKDYRIESVGLTVPKGTAIAISILGLMRDPEYFPDPQNFMPDRFSADKPMFNPDAFIPFGEGPRACIGVRMGKVVAKTALISILKNYHFECVDDRELVIANNGITMVMDGKINLKISNRMP